METIGLCKCGCGQKTRIATRNNKNAKQVKGQHLDYVNLSHYNSNGGRYTHSKGYLMTRVIGHHRADKRGYVFQHILVAEEKLGRPILKSEAVHHLDGNKQNNDPDNLFVCENNTEHRIKHQEMTALLKTGNKDLRICVLCKKYDAPYKMYLNPATNTYRHRECWKKYYEKNREHLNRLQQIRRSKNVATVS